MKKLRRFSKTNIFLWMFIIIPGTPFILGFIGFFTYVHWPRDVELITTNFTAPEDTEFITLSVHGMNDSPNSWSNELQSAVTDTHYAQLDSYMVNGFSLDWRPFSDSLASCSVVGKSIGSDLGSKITSYPKLKAVHLIGHSCGSFVVYGACLAIKAINPSIQIHTTYLDPVAVYSGIMWDFGLHNFGSCADFSDSYVDVLDHVPGSNQALPHSVTFDVTQHRLQNNIDVSPHVWPTNFYVQLYKEGLAPIYTSAEDQKTVIRAIETLVAEKELVERIFPVVEAN